MRNFILLSCIGILTFLYSCRSDFEFQKSTGGLRFSRDTVYLDTVFTNIGSSTYTLKVYNRSDKDIKIPTIQLGKGLDSKYRITVDGMTGENNRVFRDVEMLAKDSMYIFIETTADVAQADPTTFLYTDQIQFGETGNFQNVELVTLIQDAVFLYPQRFDDGTTETLPLGDEQIYGFFLDEDDPNHGNEYLFTDEKPYVIYGYAGVAPGKTLTIQAGARVHFHDSSGILVANTATINVEGTASSQGTQDGEVIFEGDRLEPLFSDIPGQWGAIWLTPGSTGNFSHATIKNGSIGLYIQANAGTVTINNCQIYDNSVYGVYAQTANITGQNTVINSAGEATLACTLGGSYDFTHCTFNNNWQSSSQFAVLVNNRLMDGTQEIQGYDLTAANFKNCIIYGSNQVEMLLQKSQDQSKAFEYSFDHCLLRFNNNTLAANPLYNFEENTTRYPGLKRNLNPRFWNIGTNNLRITTESGAVGIANPLNVFSPDLDGNARITKDAGAYQSADIPEEN
ncbi:right-handed parallel beta-helix repeat-containing protein [Flavobacterium selenitireducens]|uniref:right-handed parallel beta-helix repeat-containing protein n=1 Tax=Flavobacterium selenitireducens TaxID=2722704 RepID=UPI00168B0594|nr:right-handed parallel beta-helix repeat-containing protein [Flavobacterium selenitireducens]MBD3581385.1 right-handed parallel beta-helix repeat-containing protein [Flavobacterium selenitireducens]